MNAHDHSLGSSRVDEGSENVEDGAEGKRFADRSESRHGWVVERSKKERERRGGRENLGKRSWWE